MKRLLVLAALLGVAAIVYAAAPAPHNLVQATGDITISTSYTASAGWAVKDSIVIVASDSARSRITVTGTAVLEANQKLYVGFGADSANRISATDLRANSDLDTFFIAAPSGIRTAMRMPFAFTYNKTNNGALTDTIYFNFAAGDAARPIEIEDLVISVDVNDQ